MNPAAAKRTLALAAVALLAALVSLALAAPDRNRGKELPKPKTRSVPVITNDLEEQLAATLRKSPSPGAPVPA